MTTTQLAELRAALAAYNAAVDHFSEVAASVVVSLTPANDGLGSIGFTPVGPHPCRLRLAEAGKQVGTARQRVNECLAKLTAEEP